MSAMDVPTQRTPKGLTSINSRRQRETAARDGSARQQRETAARDGRAAWRRQCYIDNHRLRERLAIHRDTCWNDES
jgi:hypothetical protein